ncbi:hypothetical protein AGMMS49992_14890 [Clostridia bacterium]|nr:hypothetical protein AGMMS49992_14890 [Clostridia bacterium]
MRKFCLLLFIPLLLLFVSCDSGQRVKTDSGIQSTDLSNIEIDGLKIGVSIDNADLTKYTPADIANSEYTYDYNEIRIAVDENGLITRLCGTFSAIPFSLNNNAYPSTIDETIDILGENYNNYWFDSEQKIKANTYIDKGNFVTFTIAYSTINNELVWVILSSVK